MDENKILLGIALIAVIVSLVAAGFTYYSISNLVTRISGFATEGTANLTVESLASINFTKDSIDFGSGRIDSGQTRATLITVGSGSVTNGNWTADTGFNITNIGNVNVSIILAAGKTAAAFLGGTDPIYGWNVTEIEANSCSGTLWDLYNNTWQDANGSFTICEILDFLDGQDEIRIDINISFAEDSNKGDLTDTITATASAV